MITSFRQQFNDSKVIITAYYLRTLVLISLFAISDFAQGQISFKMGYIINLDNDTLVGLINDGGEIRNSRVCTYKASTNSKISKFYPSDIKSYCIVNERAYSSKEFFINDRFIKVFAEVLLAGKINLYYYRKNKEMLYSIEKENGALTGLLNLKLPISSSSDFAKSLYSKYENMTIATYKDTLYSFFRDCDKVRNQVDNVGYNDESLINITKEYLNQTCNGNRCITFEKNLSLSKPKFGVYTGVQFINNIYENKQDQSDIKTSFPVGIFYGIPLYILSEGLFIQVELIYRNFDDHSSNRNSKSIGVPLLIKYEIPTMKFTPSIGMGKDLSYIINSDNSMFRVPQGGWFFEAGLNYKLKSQLTLFANLRVQSFQNLLVDENSVYGSYNALVKHNNYLEKFKSNIVTLFLGIKF